LSAYNGQQNSALPLKPSRRFIALENSFRDFKRSTALHYVRRAYCGRLYTDPL